MKNQNISDLICRRNHLIIGEGYKELLDKGISSLGITPIYLPANPFVDKRLQWHADLSVFRSGGADIVLAPYLRETEFAQKMIDLGMNCIFADIKQGSKYPEDTQLNACAVGRYLFCSEGISYEGITRMYKRPFRISVKQGYCGCSICVVDENSIITADRAIAAAATEKGIDSLLISPGHIMLEGFEYGFIGGAGFRLPGDSMLFTGQFNMHPDYEKIINFLLERNISTKFLTDLPVFDIGCGVFLN